MFKKYKFFFFSFFFFIAFLLYSSGLEPQISADGSNFSINFYNYAQIAKMGYHLADGGSNVPMSTYFPFFFIADFFSIFFNQNTIQYLTFISLRYIIPFISMFILLRSFLKYKDIVFIPSIFFYIYNPITAYTGFEYHFYSIYCFMPACIGFYNIFVNDYIFKRKINFICIIFVLLTIFLAQSGITHVVYASNLAIWVLCLFFFRCIFILKNKLNIIKFLLLNLVLLILLIIFNFYWIYEVINNHISSLDSNFFLRLSTFVSGPSPIFDILRLLSPWFIFSGDGDSQYFIWGSYYNTTIFRILSLGLILFILYSVFFLKSNYRYFFITVFIITLLLNSGFGGSFAPVSEFLYSWKFMLIFRDPSKFALSLLTLYCVLISLTLNYYQKKFYKKKKKILLLIFLVIYTALPSFLDIKDKKNPYRESYGYIPNEYFDLQSFIVNLNPDGRVLILPQALYGIRFFWSKSLPLNLYPEEMLLSAKNIATKTIRLNDYEFYDNLNILDPEYLKLLDIEYVILHHDYDFIFDKFFKKKNSLSNANLIESKLRSKKFEKKIELHLAGQTFYTDNKFKKFLSKKFNYDNNYYKKNIKSKIVIYKNKDYDKNFIFSSDKIILNTKKSQIHEKDFLVIDKKDYINYNLQEKKLKILNKDNYSLEKNSNHFKFSINFKDAEDYLLIFNKKYSPISTKIIANSNEKKNLELLNCNNNLTCLLISNNKKNYLIFELKFHENEIYKKIKKLNLNINLLLIFIILFINLFFFIKTKNV